jgi:dipeptidyl aminopeptidase/acylaminoacyl peptidase
VVRRLCGRHAEFQRPRWLTCRWLAALGRDGALACAYADARGEHVGVLDPDGALEVLDQPCVRVDGVAADDAQLGWVGATTRAQGTVCIAPARAEAQGAGTRCVTISAPPAPPGAAPAPERFTFCADGVELDGVLWRARGAPEEPAPLAVWVHPGPTGAVDRSYAPIVHLLVANGIAVAAVDTSGSTAHGRAHRERLLGRFGSLDVAECAAAARHLVDAGIANPAALFIRGTSAGGTTALLALERGVFRGAVAWYPASSFDDAATGFEAGYLAALVGPHGSDRSPLARAAHLRGSVLVIQGEDDPVVTPAETAVLLAALRGALDDVAFVAVPGEGHGFRTTQGRATALSAELDFYLRRVPLGARGADPRIAGADPSARYDASAGGSVRSAPPEPL